MSAGKDIGSVVVAGEGIVAWSTAAALKKRIPFLEITVVETPIPPDALTDRIISTLPSICAFHQDIGIGETDAIKGADSGLRLGTCFEGWSDGQASYVHAYGPCGAPIGVVPFHQIWLRSDGKNELPAFDRFSAAGELARTTSAIPSASQPVGLQLTLDRYREMMRAYSRHLGVRCCRGEIAQVSRTDSGFIDSLVLTNGEHVAADLFVDCIGPGSPLQQQIGATFIDWSAWLPCDRVIIDQAPPDHSVERLDRLSAMGFGWTWHASSPRLGSRGIAYCSTFATDAEAGAAIGSSQPSVVIKQGRRQHFWVGNCVALGDSAVTIEPLEWANLHLAHSQIDRIIAMMPGRDCAEIETRIFNDECAAEADRVRDFLCLHYICADRPEPFWRAAQSIQPPPSLEHSLSLFRERGRLPYYQEETFTRDSWLTVLLGQGVRPSRLDPLTDLVSEREAEQGFAAMQQMLHRLNVAPAPELLELNPHGIR